LAFIAGDEAVVLDQIGRACWQRRHLLRTLASVLGSHTVGKLDGGCQRVIVWHGLLSLGAVWSDGALLDCEVGAAVQMVDEFHNDIVVRVDEVPGT
jgi:hypothetical protein